jgi:hypothetical protein
LKNSINYNPVFSDKLYGKECSEIMVFFNYYVLVVHVMEFTMIFQNLQCGWIKPGQLAFPSTTSFYLHSQTTFIKCIMDYG